MPHRPFAIHCGTAPGPYPPPARLPGTALSRLEKLGSRLCPPCKVRTVGTFVWGLHNLAGVIGGFAWLGRMAFGGRRGAAESSSELCVPHPMEAPDRWRLDLIRCFWCLPLLGGGAARDGLKYLTFWRCDGVGNVIFLNLLLAGLYRLGGKRHPCA